MPWAAPKIPEESQHIEACQGHALRPPGGLWDSPSERSLCGLGSGSSSHCGLPSRAPVRAAGAHHLTACSPARLRTHCRGGAATCHRNNSAGKTKGLSSPSSLPAGAVAAWQALWRLCPGWCSWSLVPLPPPPCAAAWWPCSGKQHASFSATLGKPHLIRRSLVRETCSLPRLALPSLLAPVGSALPYPRR